MTLYLDWFTTGFVIYTQLAAEVTDTVQVHLHTLISRFAIHSISFTSTSNTVDKIPSEEEKVYSFDLTNG